MVWRGRPSGGDHLAGAWVVMGPQAGRTASAAYRALGGEFQHPVSVYLPAQRQWL